MLELLQPTNNKRRKPVMDGCILYLDGRYGCNDPATQTWYDLSGMGNDGTLNNFAYAGTSGWTGKGLGFDGVDDYVEVQHSAEFDVTEFTLEILIKTPSTITQTGYKNLISKCDEAGTAENRDYNLYVYSETGKITRLHLSTIPFGRGSIALLPEQYEANSIHHIAVTVNATGLITYYSDGEEFATHQGNPGKAEQPYNIRICKANNFWEGEILLVRIYNRALSQREITQNYLASRCIMPLRHIDNPTTPVEILQNELAAKFCPLFHDHYNTAGVEWEVAQSTKMTRLGTTVNKTAGSDFDSIYPWSEMKLCNVNDDGEITAYIGDSGFKRDGTNGQVMVKIPKFYYRHVYGEAAKKHQFWISEHPISGFKLHPAFIRAGVEKPYVLLGAYKAGEIVDDGKTKLTSVSGAIPAVDRNINTFRTQAQNRGTGWEIVDALTRNAVALLYLVEYADTNSQSAIGAGVTDSTNTAAIASGGCDYLVGASGNAVGKTGKVSVSYRGLEDLWGNVWEFVDGINIKADYRLYVADHGFASDVFDEPYTDAGFNLPGTNSWVNNFACSAGADWLLMPSAVGASSGYIPDYYYQATGNRVAVVGGHWTSGLRAGLFCWSVSYTSSNAALTVGARLLLIP